MKNGQNFCFGFKFGTITFISKFLLLIPNDCFGLASNSPILGVITIDGNNCYLSCTFLKIKWCF